MPKRHFVPSEPLGGKYHIISSAERCESGTEDFRVILTLRRGPGGYLVVEIPLVVMRFGTGVDTNPPLHFENKVLEIKSGGQFNTPLIRNPENGELEEIDDPPKDTYVPR